MQVEGIQIIQEEGLTAIIIEDFSKELEDLIRKQLSGIYNGFAEVAEMPEYFSYPFTLQSFLDRFESKAEDTQKGMIGELLGHIMINTFFDQLSSLSVLKNKEERSIKKGFDIIYYHNIQDNLWYTEIKSGKSEDGSATSNEYNKVLLKRANDGIVEMFESGRNSLWESALVDVKLVVEQGGRRVKMRELLANQSPVVIPADTKRNVILVSVLYHGMSDKILLSTLKEFYSAMLLEGSFKDVIVISIQKATFQKVANFLKTEAQL